MDSNLIYQMGSLLEDLETVVSEIKSIKPNIEDLHWFRLCLHDIDVIIVSMKHIERNING